MKVIYLITKYMQYVACVVLAGLMSLVVSNIVGRTFFSFPLTGTVELAAYMMVLIVALGLGWMALERKHIKVDLVMNRLPKRAQFIIDNAMFIVSFIMLAVMTWANARQALGTERYSAVLWIPENPFRWVFTIGFGLLCICALVIMIENFKKRGKDES